MRTGVYYKATRGGCRGLIQNFSVIPDPPAHATMGSPPETSSLETLPSTGESSANRTSSHSRYVSDEAHRDNVRAVPASVVDRLMRRGRRSSTA